MAGETPGEAFVGDGAGDGDTPALANPLEEALARTAEAGLTGPLEQAAEDRTTATVVATSRTLIHTLHADTAISSSFRQENL